MRREGSILPLFLRQPGIEEELKSFCHHLLLPCLPRLKHRPPYHHIVLVPKQRKPQQLPNAIQEVHGGLGRPDPVGVQGGVTPLTKKGVPKGFHADRRPGGKEKRGGGKSTTVPLECCGIQLGVSNVGHVNVGGEGGVEGGDDPILPNSGVG